MSSHRRYQVFKGNSDVVVHYAKSRVALEWVARGLAEVVGEKQIRMVVRDREVVKTSDSMRSSGQDKAYELAAIETNFRLVQGGGVSGHRRQLGINPFSGAKVGHQ